MTNKITSFFQVNKSSKREKSNNPITDGGRKEGPGITRQRDLECKDSTDGGNDTSTRIPIYDNGENSTTTATKRLKLSSECDEVQQLLMHLNEITPTTSNQVDIINATRVSNGLWTEALQNHFDSKSFQALSKFIATERMKQTIYPPPHLVWSALNLCPLHNVKVVIVGQDPYHGPNQAHGLSFSVLPGCPIPPSLKNMCVTNTVV